MALYLLCFFAAPQLWWSGRDLPSLRYALYPGYVLLGVVVVHAARSAPGDRRASIVYWAAIGMAINATLVHFLLAARPDISLDGLVEALKFALLFVLMSLAMKDRRDFAWLS